MSRSLSAPEWSQFMQDVNVPSLHLPPWGGVVEWNGLDVLVFVGADGNVWTSDVTDDFQSWIAANENQQAIYDPNQQLWYYQLPQQVLAQIQQVAQTSGTLTAQAVSTVAKAVGQTAADILAPTAQTLSPILIVALVVLGLFLIPRR